MINYQAIEQMFSAGDHISKSNYYKLYTTAQLLRRLIQIIVKVYQIIEAVVRKDGISHFYNPRAEVGYVFYLFFKMQ